MRRAKRIEPIRGFGIDQVAAAADAGGRSVLRMENLDTDIPPPAAAIPEGDHDERNDAKPPA